MLVIDVQLGSGVTLLAKGHMVQVRDEDAERGNLLGVALAYSYDALPDYLWATTVFVAIWCGKMGRLMRGLKDREREKEGQRGSIHT